MTTAIPLTVEELTAVPTYTPRIRVTDFGDFWGWADTAGRNVGRAKTDLPPLPVLLDEVLPNRSRAVVLLPPID